MSKSSDVLLIETIQPNVANLKESKNGEKNWYLEGIFMQGEVKNGNGRIYPMNVLTEAVEKAQNKLKSGYTILGELEHPDTLNVNLNNVSHMIESFWINGNNIYGRAKILDTPKGEIVKALLKEGIKLGVSSRGSGSTIYENNVTMVESFNLITVDIVATPSAPDAYPKGLNESIQEIIHDENIKTLSEAVREDTKAQAYLEKEIKQFLNNIINKHKFM